MGGGRYSVVGGIFVLVLTTGLAGLLGCGAPPNTNSQVAGQIPTPASPSNPSDAGTPSNPDQKPSGPVFGGVGPWPVENVTYGAKQGILETPIVGTTTDESQNLWVATHEALYLLKPGQTTFHRYAAADGLHLQSNPVRYCDSNFGGGDKSCPIYGAAADPGITEIVGGGTDEVFVGYAGIDDGSGDWSDLNRHTGKLDRIKLNADGTLTVDRFDLVSVLHGAMFWHNRTIQRMIFDHFVHPHDLYVGTNHGVDLLRPDHFRYPKPGEWFDNANIDYMGDHLHPRVCYHAPCDNTEANQRMGDWRGLALTTDGNLWVAGRWTAGEILWDANLVDWFMRPGDKAFLNAFGDPYPMAPNDQGFVNEPVFRVPQEGDAVSLSAVSVAPDGRVWFASGPFYGSGVDATAYGVAVWDGHKFTRYDPVAEIGLGEAIVKDLIALPDGRIAVAGPSHGVVIWDPRDGSKKPLPLPDNMVERMELDTMVSPPALHVSTYSGATVIRKLP